jgi:prephenate dehydrogenase
VSGTGWRALAVVGVGLLGASVALAARRRRVAGRIVGVDRDPEALDSARRLGCLDEAATDLGAAACGDLVVVCVPVDRVAAVVRAVAAGCRAGAVLTDVGSTKAAIVREVGALPGGVAFVGSHPLAGSEKQGPDHADGDLFAGRLVVVTPGPDTDERAARRVDDFWRALGARVERMTPEAHDEAVALTSHLPHVVASALAGSLPPELAGLTATGFRDTTRVAAGGPELWAAILRSNRDAVLAALGRFGDRLERFRRALADDDAAALLALLAEGKTARDDLDLDAGPLDTV